MRFGDFLSKVVLNEISRQDFLRGLQLAYEEFSGVDEITLSRWVNNVTQPSTYRQLLIAHHMDKLAIYLELCEMPDPSAKSMRLFESYAQQFESTYHFLRSPSCDDVLRFSEGSSISHRFLFSFIFRIKIIKKMKDKLDIQGGDRDISVFYIGKENCAESCLFFHKNFSDVTNALSINVDHENKLFFGVSYFKNRAHCEIISGFAFNHVLRHHFSREGIYFAVRGRIGMSFFEMIGATLVHSQASDDDFGTLYIYYLEMKDFFSSPIVLDLIKKQMIFYDRYIDLLTGSGVPLKYIKQ